MEYETRNMGRGLRVTEHKLAWRTKADRRRDGRFGGRIPGLMDIWFPTDSRKNFCGNRVKGVILKQLVFGRRIQKVV